MAQIIDIYFSRRMMMTSGSGVNYKSMFDAGSQVIGLLLFLMHGPAIFNLADRSLQRKVSSHCSRVLVPTFFVVWLVLVCYPSTTSYRLSCSAKSTLEVMVLSIFLLTQQLNVHSFQAPAKKKVDL